MPLLRLFVVLLPSLLCLNPVQAQPGAPTSEEQRIQDHFKDNRPRVSLILSGGGARGFAHIGVLDVLDSAGIEIDLIVGTSIGASIGGLYAAGYTPKQLETFALSTNWAEIMALDDDSRRIERFVGQKDQDNALLSLRFNGFLEPVLPKGLSNGQRWTMLLNTMVINAPHGMPSDFLRHMKVPFVAVATDIVAGQRRLLTQGDLTAAIRASATWPIMFNPVPNNDTAILVDGGLLSNIPVDVAKRVGSQIIVVSNTTSRLRTREEIQNPWDVADQVVSLMMQRQIAESVREADYVVTPVIASNEFEQLAEAIEAGRTEARAIVSKLKAEVLSLPTFLADGQSQDTLLSHVLSMRIHGIDAVDSLSILPVMRSGRPLTRAAVKQQLLDPVIAFARARGYMLASIDSVLLDEVRYSADVYLNAGAIDSVRVSGNESMHSDVVLREFPISRGDVFQASEAEQGIRNLIGTGLFEFVGLEIAPRKPASDPRFVRMTNVKRIYFSDDIEPWDLILSVQPKAAFVLRLGVLADNEFGAQFWSEFGNENVLGSGTDFSLKGSLGPESRRISATFDAPRLFRSIATLFAQVYSGYQDIPAYVQTINGAEGRIASTVTEVVRETRDIGARLRAGGQIGRIGAITAEYRFEKQRSFNLANKSTYESFDLGSLKGEVVFDSRDDRAYPSEGSYLSLSAEAASQAIGSEIGFTKLAGVGEQTLSLSRLHKLIPRIKAGFGDLTLPRQEQFALGGIESFYGLNEYEHRGRQLVQGSLTYQVAIPHALFFPTFVSFRYDLGATWLVPEAVKFEALVHGIGAQVGLKTPFGLARFAIGENFRFLRNGVKPLLLGDPRFYFSIGSLIN